MKRKHIDKFYSSTVKSKDFEIFALSLPITLIHKNMFNDLKITNDDYEKNISK